MALISRRELVGRHSLDAKSMILLSVGELNANKNHQIVVKALGQMKENCPDMFANLHYLIAGQGELWKEIVSLAAKFGVSAHVHMLGYRNDVQNLLLAADIFLLPSKREGLNVGLMEAIAGGLPCIASDIRGNRDLLEPAWLVPPMDVSGWYSKIKELYASPVRSICQETWFSSHCINKKMERIYRNRSI